MKNRIDSIHSLFRAGILTECNPDITICIDNPEVNGKALSIHPNPFNNQFNINYTLENNTALLEVYNVIGEKIQTKTITQNSTLVDLSDQTKGFYFVTIIDGTNRISQKIVKQ